MNEQVASTRRIRTGWAAALIGACTLAFYANSLSAPFVGLDDKQSIRDNPHIRSLWPLSEAISLPLWDASGAGDSEDKRAAFAEAKAMLDRRPDSKFSPPATNAYTRRLQLYRGEIGPDAVLTPADTDDVQIATLAYGLGNWHLVRGDTAQARTSFERSVKSGGWPAFGFIVSEAELRRLR